jgi:CheY-like chemotaxis protein
MSQAQGRPIEILLVEDNPADVRLTLETMKEVKVANRINVVTDGEQATAFLQRTGEYSTAPKPDLVILDLNLPRKDGREVLADIKGDPNLRRIPVVILTTSTRDEDIFTAYDLAANCYINKPVDLDEFNKIVQSIENFWLTIVKLPDRAAI